MKKKRGGTEIAFRPQTIIEARYDLDRRQNDIIDILLGIVGIVMLLFLIPMCIGLKDSTKNK